jgi:hypothetical protein
MKAVVGSSKRSDAERSGAELVLLEIPRDRINILTPEMTNKQIAAVPAVAGEKPGMGEAIGAPHLLPSASLRLERPMT